MPIGVEGDIMDVGTTVEAEFTDCRYGYLKSERQKERFSIAGDGSVGVVRSVRVVKNRDGAFIAVTEGATLHLRVDEVVDDSTVRADPSYGPVFISASLTPAIGGAVL